MTTGVEPGTAAGPPLTQVPVPVPVPVPAEILSALPGEPSVAWVRGGEGLIGWGVAAQEHFLGEERFSRAQRWFAEWCEENGTCRTTDPHGAEDRGAPVAFAAFTFDDEDPGSVVVIPRTLLTVRGGRAWLTSISPEGAGPTPGREQLAELGNKISEADPGSTVGLPVGHWHDRPEQDAAWTDAVARTVDRIAAGELDKVVLARKIEVEFESDLDIRPVLARLAADYPECWTFHVDGLLGATPELLIRRFGADVSSRVLAGTVRSSGSARADARNAAGLRASSKDLAEHEYAVRSVAHALAVHCTDLAMADQPAVLPLTNVQHLATDIHARLADGSSALALAATLHPTAAVCGTPTERAMAVIAEMESINRARYSGPVGWFNADGDGEFGIALRCAEVAPDRRSAELFAGCGLVADSLPEAELAESNAKLDAMRQALDLS